MPKVIFLPNAVQVDAEIGEPLLSVTEKAGVLIDASCNGIGTCGACKVKVEPSPVVSDCDRDHLTPDEIRDGYRLACQLKVECDCQVTVPSSHGGTGRKKKLVRMPEGFNPDVSIRCISAKVPKAKMDYQVNDIDRIREAFDLPNLIVDPGILCEMHRCLDEKRGLISLVVRENELVHVKAGEPFEIYGISFDIGTTTVVGMLWNLADASLTDVETRTNYQSIFGADVISRIAYSLEDEPNLMVLREKVIRCCNDIIDQVCDRAGISHNQIVDITVDGNTTMTHLALGVTPRSLSRTPFAPVFCEAQNIRACDAGFGVAPFANAHFLPVIAGHVGSDIVGMMIAADADIISGCHVAIDIGTNGEVVAVKDGQMLCCSTAAGPAFEGATINQGMRAAPGAIESVGIADGDIFIKTIEDIDPVGMCGSGLIDAVAVLLDAGVVDDSGRMLSRDECLEAGVCQALADRVMGSGLDARFALAHVDGSPDIYLTQGDVREVQLAKGAILAGIQTLMKQLGVAESDLDSIKLAGAFGNYISRESALRIGLLPRVSIEKVEAIGNAAGVGCCMALLSSCERKRAADVARSTRHIELSRNDDFQDFYVSAMTFA